MPYNKSEQGATAPMKRRPMRRRKKVCVFCADKNNEIDYKDVNKLRRYISELGKILPRSIREHLQLLSRELDTSLLFHT